MIEVIRLDHIEDETERAATAAVIAQRREYYERLFANSAHPPTITVRYDGRRPLEVRITFSPHNRPPVTITVPSYQTADAATKHAFKKLRRVAKNYFVKTKTRHRR